MTIRLPLHVRAELIAHARHEAPNECCGMLIGRVGEIHDSVRVRNVADAPATRYRVDPAEHIALNRRLRGSSLSIVGAYHSHPGSPAIPSETDQAEALYPEFVWLIVSLAAAGGEIAAFRLTADRFVSIPIVEESNMSGVIDSVRGEFQRYKTLGEGALLQMADAELCAADARTAGNSVAVICAHVAGNLRSRFTDFLTTDGEKPWRKRDEEFEPRLVTREALLANWETGWRVLFDTLASLDESRLHDTVKIRGEAVPVHGALHRALAHVAYHVGQIVYIGKVLRGKEWNYLSIPPGQSDAANARMNRQ